MIFFYFEQVGDMIKQFVIPQGCLAAMHLHQVRNDAKLVYRTLFHVSKEEDVIVSPLIFQFTALLSNVAAVLALYANKLNNIEEIPFHTESYILNK